jgi:hypothetical protein
MGSKYSKRTDTHSLIVPTERIEHTILLIRGEKVILDRDLADLYGVETKRLNEQIRRNRNRFPADFLFRLTNKEVTILKSHFATSRLDWGGRLRAFLATHKELAEKLNELERKLESHDEQIVAIIDAIKRLMAPPGKVDKHRIGFRAKDGAPAE